MISAKRRTPPWLFVALALFGASLGLFFSRRIGGAFAPLALTVIVPPLLFEAAWNLDFAAVRRTWRPVALMIGPGVLLAALLVAGMLYALSLPLGVAWMLGAALAATDPVAVIALARSLRVPPRLLAIVEAESLFNDAIAVALVRARNLLISLAALVVGGLLGDLVARFCLAMRVRNVPVLWLFSVLGLYGASFGIEWLGGSGIVAVVAFGIAMRSRIEHGTARELLEGVDAYWRRCALALNVVLFAWMGASLNLADSEGVLLASVAVLVALALARLVMVYGLLRAVPEVASSWRAFMTASGMRGALSLALVLSIGAGVPGARRARAIAFVVVLSTMLVGALLLPRSTRALAD